MGKYRPAGSKKVKAQGSKRGLIPCAILIFAGFAIISLLFYEILKSGR
jgi:hypothetical protein